ncbi:MAG: HesA/MoeB/ThiF family protein [Alphaproteobacteria bacterium]|nr:HesA/MoeB/ThiF family protein [Alphaproteobacteria bacterium SS10]
MSDTIDIHDPAIRYARHVVLPELGGAGQQRLAASRVAVVGVGGLGSAAAQYLAAAGVGALTLIDDDTVDLSNLQRQVLFTEADLDKPKVQVASTRLNALNSRCEIEQQNTRLTDQNATTLLDGHDVVVDATDLITTRYAINDTCAELKTPWVMGAVIRFEGQVAVFDPRVESAPDYRRLFPELPPPDALPACAEAGVLGAIAGIIGAWQAMVAVKLITGAGETPIGRIINVDGLYGNVFETRL